MDRHRTWELYRAELACGSPLLERRWAAACKSLDELHGLVRAGRAGPLARQAMLEPAPVPGDVVLHGDDDLPDALGELRRPPLGMHLKGNRSLLGSSTMRVAIVGSRRPRVHALEVARRISSQLSRRGVTIVSGLAIGIDGAAHRGAVDVGAPTIAVLGSGIERCYPSRHRSLADQIVACGGLLVSEYGLLDEARPWRFPERNRIIAALCDVLVVVQAGNASGSMGTASVALELGRDVGVVPSAIDDVAFEGSLSLLRDGARAVVDAASVLRMLGMEDATSADLHEFGSYLDSPRDPGELARMVEQPVRVVASRLALLEIDGLVRRTDDGRYVNAGG